MPLCSFSANPTSSLLPPRHNQRPHQEVARGRGQGPAQSLKPGSAFLLAPASVPTAAVHPSAEGSRAKAQHNFPSMELIKILLEAPGWNALPLVKGNCSPASAAREPGTSSATSDNRDDGGAAQGQSSHLLPAPALHTTSGQQSRPGAGLGWTREWRTSSPSHPLPHPREPP